MVKDVTQIFREMEGLSMRLEKTYPGRVDRIAILIQMDEEIDRRIGVEVSNILDSYSSTELLQARAEFNRITDALAPRLLKGKGKRLTPENAGH